MGGGQDATLFKRQSRNTKPLILTGFVLAPAKLWHADKSSSPQPLREFKRRVLKEIKRRVLKEISQNPAEVSAQSSCSLSPRLDMLANLQRIVLKNLATSTCIQTPNLHMHGRQSGAVDGNVEHAVIMTYELPIHSEDSRRLGVKERLVGHSPGMHGYLILSPEGRSLPCLLPWVVRSCD